MTLNFEAIIGDQGAGKTQLMSMKLYEQHLSGVEVIANYHLNFPFTYMKFSEIGKLAPDKRNIALGMTEISVGANAYDFLSLTAREISAIISQLRKRNAVCFIDAQRYMQIAISLRRQIGKFHLMRDLDAHLIPKPPLRHRDICRSLFECTQVSPDLEILPINGKPFAIINGKPWQWLYDDRELILADTADQDSEQSPELRELDKLLKDNADLLAKYSETLPNTPRSTPISKG